MTIFFTADQHFDHANIIKYCNRPFSSVDEMNNELVKRHNLIVSSSDTVWIVGDFAWSRHKYWASRLNGKLHFLQGSHDRLLEFSNQVTLEIDGFPNITLCHYAMRSWPKSHYGTWHLFGHHHGKLEPYGLSFDIGVDCWAYAPVSIEEVATKMTTLKPIVDLSKKH